MLSVGRSGERVTLSTRSSLGEGDRGVRGCEVMVRKEGWAWFKPSPELLSVDWEGGGAGFVNRQEQPLQASGGWSSHPASPGRGR